MKRALKVLGKLLFVGLFVLSLVLNVAMFVGGAIYSVASSAVEAVTGMRTVASRHASEVAEFSSDLNAERQAKRELREEAADLSDSLVNERRLTKELQGELVDVLDELANQRLVTRQLRGEVTDLSDELLQVGRRLDDEALGLVTYRGAKVAVSDAVNDTADLISKRAQKSASREMGSMAGESLPWIGTAVIVGVTALELKDLCATITDMTHLKRAFDPSLQLDEDAHTVCSTEVPSRAELWATVKAQPSFAWESAKDLTPSLEDIRGIDISEIDWAAYSTSLSEGLAAAYDAAGGAIGSTFDSTKQGAAGVWEWLTEPAPDQDAEGSVQN